MTRPVPPRIDATIAVPLPPACPHCAGAVEATHTASQLQVDVPIVRPIVREFQIAIGRCAHCGRRVQGAASPADVRCARRGGAPRGPARAGPDRHAAYGAWRAVREDRARLYDGFGFPVSRSTLCRALVRVASRAAPTYTTLAAQVRGSPRVSLDETGWKVAAHLEWLWAAVTPETTLYRIQPGRGFDEAAALIGADYAGVLVRDGWAPYRRFEAADHQTCLAHVLRRGHGLVEILAPTTGRWPAAIADLLKMALALRDRHAAGTVSARGLAIATGQLLTRLLGLLATPRRHPALQRLATHLEAELTALFTFLVLPGTDATTWRAEQAIRPAVILRKVCGGNRSPRGARTHEILASVLQTAHQRHLDPHPILTDLLHSRTPMPAPALLSSLQ